jgi:predicted dehydrogenase
VFNIGVLKRFDTRWRQARALIEGGEIGQPKAGVHYASTNLMHSHIHSIDAFSYLMGDPGIVAVRGELLPRGVEIRDNRMLEDYIATYQIAFANGVDAWNVPAGHWELEVIGENGAVRLVNNGMRVSLRKMGSPEDPSPQGVLQHTPWYPLPEWEEVSVPSVEPNSPVVTCLEDLLDAHESGRPSIANADVTHSITEACIAVAESHQRGGAWVELPLENRDLYAFHA